MMRHRFHLAVAGLAVVMAAAQAAATDVKPPEAVTTFLGRHCADCHRGADAEAAFDVATLALDAASPAGDRRWATLLDRVADGEMPPTDADQPTAAERKAFMTIGKRWLSDAIRQRDARLGRVRGRRLTRREVERSLHAVLGIDIPLAQELPEEGRPGGFTTVADRQSMSHHQLAAHLAVVDRALDEAFRRAIVPTEPLRRDLDAAAIARHPERFVGGVPQPLAPAAEVWINPPENRPTVRTLELPRDTKFVPQLSQSH